MFVVTVKSRILIFQAPSGLSAQERAFSYCIKICRNIDPACGCGNFLIITYQRLRELEYEILKLLYDNQQIGLANVLYTKVGLHQFYGIELEDFPCQIAKVSLLLMKHLMDQEVSHYFGMNLIDFPIRDNANILQGNALRMDWGAIVPPEKLDYIIGNPPYLGANIMTQEQKADVHAVFGNLDSVGNLDYVSCWYWITAKMMNVNARVRASLVSTNSISQGEQVAILWKPLLKLGIKIDFAYRTFRWSNEARGKAAVHCIIIGFSRGGLAERKLIFDDAITITADNINPYLVDAPDAVIESRTKPLSVVSIMQKGSQPTDDGNLTLSKEEKDNLLSSYPDAGEFIRPFIGAKEYIQGLEERYCIWLVNVSPAKYAHIHAIKERIARVRAFRMNSMKAKTRQDADVPMLFQEIRQPEGEYILVPRVSSESRRYIPMGFLPGTVICGDTNLMVPNATRYEFGVLVSSAHMAWMRAVAGRLKSDYRYSAQIVYNNFVWPQADQQQKARIALTATSILETRQKYPGAPLAVLYDDTVMPPDLRRAHQDNDRAVWEAYQRAWPLGDEPACVAHLMRLYRAAVGGQA
ncbi:MAG: class I SAM-dependent DNA methyltransferase [Christensenellales bacterium]